MENPDVNETPNAPGKPVSQDVLDRREEKQRADLEEKRRLAPHKARIALRATVGDWPIDAVTGDRADLEREDVMTPLPDDFGKDTSEEMQKARRAAEEIDDESDVGVVDVDPILLSRRRDDLARDRARVAKVRGDAWTPELVENRIEEAFKVLMRSGGGGGFGPRAFGNNMPKPLTEMSDVVAQLGNSSLRKVMKRLLRTDGPPSIDEVRRMNDAIAWTSRYLTHDRQLALYVNLGGMWKAWGTSISGKCKEIGVHRQQFYRLRKEAMGIIAEGLTKDGRAPT